jgi:hypothetical protein
MNWPVDLWASLVGGGLCLLALMVQRLFGGGRGQRHARVTQRKAAAYFWGLG